MYKYIVVDAEQSASGIRDKYRGEIEAADINLTSEIILNLKNWVQLYQDFNHICYRYSKEEFIYHATQLDNIGIEIAKEIKK